jgi:hypothetical protein
VKIRVKAFFTIEYEVDDAHLEAAYGSTDVDEVLHAERESLLDGGDYFISMLSDQEAIVEEDYEVSVVPAHPRMPPFLLCHETEGKS